MTKKIIGFIVVLAMCLPMFPTGLFAATSFAGGNGTESNPYQISNAAQLKALATDINDGNNKYSGTYFKLTADINLNGSSSNQWVQNTTGSLREFAGTFDGNGHVISGLYIEAPDGDTTCGLFERVSGTVKNLGVSGEVKGYKSTGGIVGINEGTITNCYFTGTVSGTNYYTGGIAGSNNAGGIIENCFNIGTVSGGPNYTGGIAGYNYEGGTIQSCYNAGSVSGKNQVGGIAGYNYRYTNGTASKVTNCYNTGTVSGNDSVGGVVGENYASAGSCYVTNCYNIGSVSGNSDVGGVVGKNSTLNRTYVQNCYFKSGSLAGVGTDNNSANTTATGLTDSNFATQSKFSDWDFSSVWTMSDWAKRPVLKNNCFTVSFDSNGGSTVSDKYYVDYGSKYGTLPSTPTRTGYTFDGWYTASTSGTKVTANSGTITSSHTLYAHWTASKYSITYKDQGNATFSGAHESGYPTNHTYGTATTLKSASKTGYTFGGWYDNSNCTGSAVTSLGATAYVSNITLYAKWTAKQYTVTLDSRGGTVSSSSVTATYDSTYPTLPTPVRDGYTFNGWYTAASGGSKVTGGSTKVTITAAQTLYAQWTANSYTVTYDYNGATNGNSTASKSVTYDGTYGDLPTPTRTGYKFNGWYTSATGGTQVLSTTKVTITAAQTLYAQWTANSYTVTYNYNGATGNNGTASKSVTYDSSYGDLPTPTRDGYTFKGWYTAASGGSNVTSGTKVTNAAAHTLYAQWTANEYQITLDVQGGTVSGEDTITVTYDGVYTLPTPEREGYAFLGWYTASGKNGTQVKTGDKVTILDNQTLYAAWQEKFGVDTDNSTVTINATYGETTTANLSELLDGYIKYFSGATSSSGNFNYTVKADEDNIGASIIGNVLTIPDTVVANENGDDYYTLTILATEIAPQIATLSLNYGTDPVELTVKVHVARAGTSEIPDVVIDYENELLRGTTAEMEYRDPVSGEWTACTEDMPLEGIWDGEAMTVYIRYAGDSDHDPGTPLKLDIPARPAVPDVDIEVTKSDSSITVTSPDNTDGEYEFSIDGENWFDIGEFGDLTPGTEHTVYVRTKAADDQFASESKTKDVITVDENGDTDLLNGETVITEGGTVTNKNGTVTVTDGDTVTAVSPIPDEGTKVDKDGNVTVPSGSTVNRPDCPDMTLPDGGIVAPDGSVALEDGESVQIGHTTEIAPPEGGGVIKPNDENSVVVPDGSTVTPPGGTPVITVDDCGDRAIVDKDGNITYPDGGGTAEIGDGVVVTVPDEGTVKPNGDGTVTLPDGSTVTYPDCPDMTLPEGGIVDPDDGSVKLDDGESVQIGETTEIAPPEGGGVIRPNDENSVVVPDGSIVTPPHGTPAITVDDCGNRAIVDKDGNITYPDGGTAEIGDDLVVTVPDEGTVKPNGDGTVTLPDGSTVTYPDSPDMTLPEGGIVDPDDGSVKLDDCESVQIGETTEIAPPEGGGVIRPNDENSVVVPDGSTVTPPGGSDITVDDCGDKAIVDKDGNITYPDGGTAEIDDIVVTVPENGTVEPREGGAVFIPEGSEVEIDGETVSIPKGGAIYDGSLKFSHTVTFDSQGGSDVESVSVPYGDTVNEPDVPVLAGHTFGGWYTDKSCSNKYDFSTPVTDDIKLYAKWTVNICTVTIEYEDENGETVTLEKKVTYGEITYGELLPELADKPGYIFSGWYDENNQPVDSDALVDESCTLRPVWTKCDHVDEKWSDWTSYDGETHSRTSENCKETVTEKHEWDEGRVTKEATETEDGVMTYTCKACGHTKTVTIPAAGNSSTESPAPETTTQEPDTTAPETETTTPLPSTTAPKTETTTPVPGTTTQWAETTTPVPSTTAPETTTNAPEATAANTAAAAVTEPDVIDPTAGNIIVDSNSGENAPNVSMDEETANRLETEVIANHLTEEERQAVANGADLEIILSVEDAGDTVPEQDKQAAETVITDTAYEMGQYLSVDMLKLINGRQVGKITELGAPVSVTIEVPEALRGENRAFAIVRVHDGVAEILEDQDNDPNTITILTDRFSTYAIVYQDTENTKDNNLNTGVVLMIAPFIAAAAVVIVSRKRK